MIPAILVPSIGFLAAYAVFFYGLAFSVAGALVVAGGIGGLITSCAYFRRPSDVIYGGMLGALLSLSGLRGIPDFANNFDILGGNNPSLSNATAPLFVCWQAGMLGFYCWRLRCVNQDAEK